MIWIGERNVTQLTNIGLGMQTIVHKMLDYIKHTRCSQMLISDKELCPPNIFSYIPLPIVYNCYHDYWSNPLFTQAKSCDIVISLTIFNIGSPKLVPGSYLE